MMWGDGFGMGAGWVFGWIIMLVAVALVVVGIVLLVRGLSGRHAGDATQHLQTPVAGNASGANAMRILEERYASGEIDREEFLQRKADLQS